MNVLILVLTAFAAGALAGLFAGARVQARFTSQRADDIPLTGTLDQRLAWFNARPEKVTR